MKTNKLESTALLKSFFLLVCIVCCANISAKNSRATSDSVKVKPFEQLMVVGDKQTTVTLCQNKEYAITISGGSRSDVQIETTNSTLMVYSNNRKSLTPIQITIYSPKWESVFCSLAEKLETKGDLLSDSLHVDANMIKTIDMNIQANILDLDATHIEQCTLGGFSTKANIDFAGATNSPALLQAENLRTKNMHLDSGVHDEVYVYATDTIWLKDGFLSNITILGSPSYINNQTKSCNIYLKSQE